MNGNHKTVGQLDIATETVNGYTVMAYPARDDTFIVRVMEGDKMVWRDFCNQTLEGALSVGVTHAKYRAPARVLAPV